MRQPVRFSVTELWLVSDEEYTAKSVIFQNLFNRLTSMTTIRQTFQVLKRSNKMH